MDLRPHIDRFARRLAEVEAALSDPKVFDNNQRAQELSKEYSSLKELVASGQAYFEKPALTSKKTVRSCCNPNLPIPNSPFPWRRKTLAAWKRKSPAWSKEVLKGVLPARPHRFAQHHFLKSAPAQAVPSPRSSPSDLYRTQYTATPKRTVGKSRARRAIGPTSARFKEVIFGITGSDVYKRLKYESGVHRVQRVPATEAQGRVHTQHLHRRRAARSRRSGRRH